MSSGDEKQRRLGRGLSALLPQKPAAAPVVPAVEERKPVAPPVEQAPTWLPLDLINANPDQPRTKFSEEQLKELAASIQAHGIIQPVIVRKLRSGSYQIVAGERRCRAAKLAGLPRIPVVVQDISDAALLEVALIENIQREDLSPIETARAFERLSRDMGLSQDEIGRRTGKDRATIANFIRLMRLPTEVQEMVGNGQLSMGHAKAILSLHGPDDQVELARKIVKGGLSVRQTEHEAQVALGDKEPAKPKKDAPEDPNVRAAVEALERALGTRVRIVQSGGERGRIEVEYYSQAELDRLYYLLAGEER
ncbi:MAG: hypothetical protein RL328_1320 [Acidobacteriota bacterium]|jgi:ParB family chromosome partitioning protein